MDKMRVIQVASRGGPLEMVEREIPQPGPRQVRVKVEACGLCHSDSLTKEGIWPGIQYPRIPGHEIAGVIDAIGSAVPEWKPGKRVGTAGMADTADIASVAAAATSSLAYAERFRESLATAAMPITFSSPLKRSHSFPTN